MNCWHSGITDKKSDRQETRAVWQRRLAKYILKNNKCQWEIYYPNCLKSVTFSRSDWLLVFFVLSDLRCCYVPPSKIGEHNDYKNKAKVLMNWNFPPNIQTLYILMHIYSYKLIHTSHYHFLHCFKPKHEAVILTRSLVYVLMCPDVSLPSAYVNVRGGKGRGDPLFVSPHCGWALGSLL